MDKIKPFEQLAFYDDFMFGIVMQDKELCRCSAQSELGLF